MVKRKSQKLLIAIVALLTITVSSCMDDPDIDPNHLCPHLENLYIYNDSIYRTDLKVDSLVEVIYTCDRNHVDIKCISTKATLTKEGQVFRVLSRYESVRIRRTK